MLSNFYPASEKSLEIERDLDVISSLQLHEVQVNVREVDQFQYRSKILKLILSGRNFCLKIGNLIFYVEEVGMNTYSTVIIG